MIVEMRTVAQAAKAAALTGCAHLPGRARPDGTVPASRLVDVGPGFEAHRAAVESVSVLFNLYDGQAASYQQTGRPGGQVPSGWSITAAKFEVEWPSDPERAGMVRSHFGARRKAYNWGLARVKADMDARRADPGHVPVPWTLAGLRKEWNRSKAQVAPWWAANSKEAYSSGLADLARALSNWESGRSGVRRGRKVAFPRFRSARRGDRGRVRFTTGTMRVEADRRTITVPVIGGLAAKENTRRVQRPLAQGRARILNMTLTEQWGRLFVAVSYAVRTPTARPAAKPGVRAGVDLGLRTLATVADTAGTITEFSPTPPRCGRPSPSGEGWAGSLPGAYPDRRATSRRKPSSLRWTAGACTCAGKPGTS